MHLALARRAFRATGGQERKARSSSRVPLQAVCSKPVSETVCAAFSQAYVWAPLLVQGAGENLASHTSRRTYDLCASESSVRFVLIRPALHNDTVLCSAKTHKNALPVSGPPAVGTLMPWVPLEAGLVALCVPAHLAAWPLHEQTQPTARLVRLKLQRLRSRRLPTLEFATKASAIVGVTQNAACPTLSRVI